MFDLAPWQNITKIVLTFVFISLEFSSSLMLLMLMLPLQLMPFDIGPILSSGLCIISVIGRYTLNIFLRTEWCYGYIKYQNSLWSLGFLCTYIDLNMNFHFMLISIISRVSFEYIKRKWEIVALMIYSVRCSPLCSCFPLSYFHFPLNVLHLVALLSMFYELREVMKL